MASTREAQPSQPALVLGLTLLLVAASFALSFQLVPHSQIRILSDLWPAEVGNVYALAAWTGWAHFIFAYRGQGTAILRAKDKNQAIRAMILLGAILLLVPALVLVRSFAGLAIFSGLVWIYFLDHFLKAEQTFEGQPVKHRWLNSSHLLLSFAWLSIVLLEFGRVSAYPWSLWVISLMLSLLILATGGWSKLSGGDSRSTLLSLFFIAEALVWGTIGSYSESAFLSGVYVFHIAAGSYFHYLGSYFFALSRSARSKWLGQVGWILAINGLVIFLGYLSANVVSLAWILPVLGIQWFTLWVALHLITSDLFPFIKNLRRSVPISVGSSSPQE